MSEIISDAELIRNIIDGEDQETSQTKINRHLKRFVAVRLVVPIVIVAAATYVASRLTADDTEETTEEN